MALFLGFAAQVCFFSAGKYRVFILQKKPQLLESTVESGNVEDAHLGSLRRSLSIPGTLQDRYIVLGDCNWVLSKQFVYLV